MQSLNGDETKVNKVNEKFACEKLDGAGVLVILCFSLSLSHLFSSRTWNISSNLIQKLFYLDMLSVTVNGPIYNSFTHSVTQSVYARVCHHSRTRIPYCVVQRPAKISVGIAATSVNRFIFFGTQYNAVWTRDCVKRISVRLRYIWIEYMAANMPKNNFT